MVNMIKRNLTKKKISRFAALGLSLSLVLTSFAGSVQPVYAATQTESETSAGDIESTDDASVTAEADAAAEELNLIADEDTEGIYYNANSEMRDFRDETIYFVMTTRFYDGDSSNNVQCWDGQDKNEGDEPWRGDFKGLIEKLDYIKALGFTAIWITPVVENASGYDYHGYHAIDFSEVDPRYESDGCTYQDLIDAAHAKGMKVVQDVVFNHTGNWGEENLMPIASKDYSQDLSDCEASMKVNKEFGWDSVFGTYEDLKPELQFQTRCKLLMDATYDTNNIFHHNDFIKSWETYGEQITSIAGDCIDLNTENPVVYHYLVDAYSQYISMGVDAFRVDTVKHVSRLTFENGLISGLNDAYNKKHGTTGDGNFYMFGEVCTRVRDVWNRGIPALSSPFYTWKEGNSYAWDDSETAAAIATNEASVDQAYKDHQNLNNEPTSNNAKLNGNDYHSTDYSKASGLNVIDFPMHWNFASASDAFGVAVGNDQYYNDATWNVTYVDSHDYAPDGAPENQRFAGTQAQWAENLSLMFTFRGIPCIYYGSEVEFQKGMTIDAGTTKPLAETGRAYFGDYIEGSVDVVDFGRYTNATGAMADSLSYPLSQHIQRLNRLRAAIPALRKGQYSTEGCSGGMSFKRRYTDATTDSFVLVAISGDATFSGIPGGTYVDAITGDTKTVGEGGSLSTSGIKGQGDLRVYVLNTAKTPAPGMIDGFSDFMSGGRELEIVKIDPTGVTLDKTSADLSLNETVKLTATVAPSDATNKNVVWTSSDASVATVSGGTVTAKGEGTATITATTSNGLKATATVTVKVVDVTGVTLNKTEATLDLGETVKLTATVAPSNASYKDVTWTSSNESVATVSDGTVTAKDEGTTTITAATSNGKTATATVTVKASGVKVESVSVNETFVTLEKGDTAQLTATVTPSDAAAKYAALTWTSSDESVVTVDNGLITAVKKGTATITVKTAMGPSASVEVTVNGPAIYGNAIYFEKPSNWGNKIYMYLWSGDGSEYKNGEWPGVAMTDLGDGLYGIAWPEGKENATLNVIFNDNGNQTGDLSAKMNALFNQSGYVEDVPVTVNPYDCTHKTTEVKNQSEATCTADGYTGDTYCTACKTVITKGETIAKTGHAWDAGKVTKEPTATEAGTKTYTCSNCSGTKTEVIPALGGGDCKHTGETEVKNASEATCAAEGYTGDTYCKECGVQIATGNTIPKKDHTWDAGVVTKEPTTTETGVKTYTCTQCQASKTEVIPKKIDTICTHEGTTVIQNKVEATCEAEGYTGNTYCTKCNTVVAVGTTVPATGHIWDNGKVTKQPTTTETGIKTFTCTQCGVKKTEVLPKVEDPTCTHEGTTTIPNRMEATCTSNGYTGDTICTKCNAVVDTGSIIQKTGHTWDEGKVTTEPTVTTEGVKTFTCTKCSATKTESIPKRENCNHEGTLSIRNQIPATCLADGYTGDTYCTKCGATTKTGSAIPKLAHTWNAGEVTKNPTTTETGTRTYTCTVCKTTKTEEIPATGSGNCTHADKVVKNQIAVTCKDDGRTGDTYCASCHAFLAAGTVIPATGHAFDGGIVIKQPTATTIGVKKYTCANCGEEKYESIAPIIENPTCTHVGTVAVKNQSAATCTATGYTGDSYCTKCNAVIQTGTVIAQTDHSWNSGVVTLPATGTENGYMTYTCTTCASTKLEIIPATGETDADEDDEEEEEQEAVEVGDVEDDDAGSASYTVTSITSNTVTYEESNKNAATVKIPDTVKIGGKTYKVTAIASSAFKGDKTVKSITIGSNVKTIGSNAFKNCTNLTKVAIGKNVTKIGASAFYGCSKLTSIVIPSKGTSIGSKAFYKCTSLKAVVLSANLTTIGASAFYKCTKLTNITIPSKVSSIGSSAFYGCKKLKTITIKTSKLASSKIGSKAFKGIYAKATIKVPGSKVSAYKTLLQKKGVSKKATVKSY